MPPVSVRATVPSTASAVWSYESLVVLDYLATHGERDAVVSVVAGRAVAERLPDADLSVYPDCGHTPFREAPDRFDRELRAFVESVT